MAIIEFQRIVAAIEELDLCAQHPCGAFRLVPTARLHGGERRALLFPGKLAFATLAKGQTDDLHVIAAFGVKCDGASSAPNEIAGVRSDNKTSFHAETFLQKASPAREHSQDRLHISGLAVAERAFPFGQVNDCLAPMREHRGELNHCALAGACTGQRSSRQRTAIASMNARPKAA